MVQSHLYLLSFCVMDWPAPFRFRLRRAGPLWFDPKSCRQRKRGLLTMTVILEPIQTPTCIAAWRLCAFRVRRRSCSSKPPEERFGSMKASTCGASRRRGACCTIRSPTDSTRGPIRSTAARCSILNPPLYFALLRAALGSDPSLLAVRGASIAGFMLGLLSLARWTARALDPRARSFMVLVYVLSPALLY